MVALTTIGSDINRCSDSFMQTADSYAQRRGLKNPEVEYMAVRQRQSPQRHRCKLICRIRRSLGGHPERYVWRLRVHPFETAPANSGRGGQSRLRAADVLRLEKLRILSASIHLNKNTSGTKRPPLTRYAGFSCNLMGHTNARGGASAFPPPNEHEEIKLTFREKVVQIP
jgi:hypothetical protein